jgi:hypothetical protein
MIKVRDCAFQDDSYPCGYKDEGKLPDCDLCHKIRLAGIKEVVEWVDKRIDWKFALNAQLGGHINISTKEWQAKLKEWGL